MSLSATRLLAVCSLAAVLGACSSAAQRESMVAPSVTVAKKSDKTVSVATSGGAETNPMGPSSISDADFKAAIESSIQRSGVFRGVVQGAGGDYQLTVNIVSTSKPMFGASFTVDMEAGWTLTRTSDQSIVWRQSIKSTFTGGALDSLIGTERLRMAVEGAARNNIAKGLQAIGELGL